jgi:hypothetical protein
MTSIVAELKKTLNCSESIESFDEIVELLLKRVQSHDVERFGAFFEYVEHQLIFGEPDTKQAFIVGLLENLKNRASLLDIDYAIFENWLGPETYLAWRWLEKRWQGKNSLADTSGV